MLAMCSAGIPHNRDYLARTVTATTATRSSLPLIVSIRISSLKHDLISRLLLLYKGLSCAP